MKVSTSHDVSTHQLENPDQYITKGRKSICVHSLDELPQVGDIFVKDSCIVGTTKKNLDFTGASLV